MGRQRRNSSTERHDRVWLASVSAFSFYAIASIQEQALLSNTNEKIVLMAIMSGQTKLATAVNLTLNEKRIT